jgi:hypothetical protein
MSRGRAWRRYKSDCHFLRILKRQVFNRYFRFRFASGDFALKIFDPIWTDKIGSSDIMIYKSIRTTKWQSRCKVKWGKKGRKNFDWSFDPNTRPKDKQRFKKELIEHGY